MVEAPPTPPSEEYVPTPKPATFEFSAFYIPDVIKIGETATISFTITNTGDEAGTYTIILSLDGVVLETREVTLGPKENKVVSFQVIPPAVGTFVIQIVGRTIELRVEPELTVSQDLIKITVPPVYIDKIAIDAPAVVQLTESSIQEITISVWREVSGIVLKVNELIGKPTEIPDPEGAVYSYLEIVAEKLSNSDITSALIKFKVDRSWVENENIEENSIVLLRYHEGAWQSLQTEKYGEDAEYIYFSAKTPGFSVFAISGKRAAKLGPAVAPTLPTQPFVPMPSIYLVAITALILIGVILAVVWRYISLGTKKLPQE